MRHRIFIAINLPEEIKRELVKYQEKWPELPIRWTKKENLHITLIFLGSLSDEELLKVCKTIKEITSQNSPFLINLKKILYGPPKKIPPRMVWVEGICPEIVEGACPELTEGKKVDKLSHLQKTLQNSLLSSIVLAKEDLISNTRPYIPHITLGRIKTWEFRQIEPEERPEVNEEINLNFKVNSIEIMESRLKRGGAEYIILESVPLTNLHEI